MADGGRASVVKRWRVVILMQTVNLPCLFLSLDWHLDSGSFSALVFCFAGCGVLARFILVSYVDKFGGLVNAPF